jgi:hypothetical protein
VGDEEKTSVKIDIGAKASVELKAEVPKESMGRALDALMDIIRPFTEARGLKADNIRLQRAEIAYKIAAKTRETAELEQLEIKPPPVKFLIPFLEKCSLEDQDEELHSRWSTLLTSATTHYESRHLTYVDILTRLSSQELLLLEEVCLSQKSFPETYHPDGHTGENRRAAEVLAKRLHFGRHPVPRSLPQEFSGYIADHPLHYGRVMYARPMGIGGVPFLYTEYGVADTPNFQSLEILERERLVTRYSVEFTGGVMIGYFDINFLGINFVRDCSPRGREAVKRHSLNFQARVVPRR